MLYKLEDSNAVFVSYRLLIALGYKGNLDYVFGEPRILEVNEARRLFVFGRSIEDLGYDVPIPVLTYSDFEDDYIHVDRPTTAQLNAHYEVGQKINIPATVQAIVNDALILRVGNQAVAIEKKDLVSSTHKYYTAPSCPNGKTVVGPNIKRDASKELYEKLITFPRTMTSAYKYLMGLGIPMNCNEGSFSVLRSQLTEEQYFELQNLILKSEIDGSN